MHESGTEGTSSARAAMAAGDPAVLLRSGRLHEAESAYRQGLHARPGDVNLLSGLGVCLAQLGRVDEAVAVLEQALKQCRDKRLAGVIAANLGTALLEAGRATAALDALDSARSGFADPTEIDINRANALVAIGRRDEAQGILDAIISRNAHPVRARVARASLHSQAGRHALALADCEAAIAGGVPNANLWFERAYALGRIGRYQDSVAAFDEAIAKVPADAPAVAEARYSQAQTLLMLGELRRGFELFEWRWRVRNTVPHPRPPQKLWLGREDICGRTLLVHFEQGFGDTIQFCRYVPMLAARGARVVLEIPLALRRLLASLDGVAQLITLDDPEPDYDWHVPLMSLPHALGTMPDRVPAAVPYLRPPADLVQRWAERLGQRSRPRAAIVWSGKPTHANDHNRSLRLRQFAPIIKGAMGSQWHWVSVQKGVRDEDRDDLARLGVEDPGAMIDDFADAAAIIANSSLVIAVDTAAAHLAGALGTPLWILIPHVPDWRWMLARQDSPWYPSARLIRQVEPGDWTGALSALEHDLAARFA